jgi:hypothetical protein
MPSQFSFNLAKPSWGWRAVLVKCPFFVLQADNPLQQPNTPGKPFAAKSVCMEFFVKVAFGIYIASG